MNLKPPIDLIKRSSWCDLLLIGLLLTPASMVAWTSLLEFAGVMGAARGLWVLILVLFHFLAIAIMIGGSNRYRDLYRAMTLILGYLGAKGFTMVSFATIREKYGDQYTDDYLMEVITEFPQYLRIAKLKGDQTGVARLSQSDRESLPPNAPEED